VHVIQPVRLTRVRACVRASSDTREATWRYYDALIRVYNKVGGAHPALSCYATGTYDRRRVTVFARRNFLAAHRHTADSARDSE